MSTPNVNFFLHYVPYLKDLPAEHPHHEKYGRARSFYGSEQKADYIDYMNTGSADTNDFIEYASNNEKTHGLFNADGLLSREQCKILRERLRKTKSPIWCGLITFEELFGKRCNTYEQAIELMKTDLPRFFRNADMKADNITWFAALHTNTDNPHIHFCFFENEPWRVRRNHDELQFSDGHTKLFAIDKFKIDIELRLNQWNVRTATLRNQSITAFKQAMIDHKKREIVRQMEILIEILPKTGKHHYDALSYKERNIIDNISNLYIESNPEASAKLDMFFDLVKEKDNAILEICKTNDADPSPHLLFEKYRRDLYRRFGNCVLQQIKSDIEAKKEKWISHTKAGQKRIKKADKIKVWNLVEKLSPFFRTEADKMFEEFLEKLDDAEIDRLREEGYLPQL